jgi:hypothetical protein
VGLTVGERGRSVLVTPSGHTQPDPYAGERDDAMATIAHTETRRTLQFRTIGTAKRGTLRVQWSDDAGQTWHEPETAPVAVAQAWQALQARTQDGR